MAVFCAPNASDALAEAPVSTPTFTWTVPPFAPAFINDGDTLRGYAADTQNWFVNQLPNYKHSILHVPLARLLAEMRSGSSQIRCSTTLIPTPERREYIVFAKTILLHLPVSVVIRAKDEPIFDPFLSTQGHIELDRLLANRNLNSAIRIGRAYGRQVDATLALHQNAPQIMKAADDTKFMRMLTLDRIDWTLYFPSEAEYYRRQRTPNLEIKALPIAGNTTLLMATIGCANTPAGRKAIADINAIIDQNPAMPWTKFYTEWLSPPDREWFNAAKSQYISSNQYEARLEYRPAVSRANTQE